MRSAFIGALAGLAAGLLPVVAPAPAFGAEASEAAGVIDLRRTPHAKLKTVPVGAVTIHDGFWSPRRKVNVERSIPTLLELLEQNGVVDNFRRVSGRKKVDRKGPLYTDSDLYKWMEAVAFVLQSEDRPELRSTMDRLIDEAVAAQEPSGYLNTYYVDDRTSKRWSEMDRGHELYCLGHLLQGAIAYYRAGGNRRLLDAGIKFVDYLLRDFGPGKRPLLAGHPEIEMALIELYRTTGDRRYVDLAAYILTGDPRLNLAPRQLVYMFSGRPFTQRTKMEGHSVRACYAATGATDFFLETGDQAYWRTLENLWTDMTTRKMYITGGVGSRSSGEAFGEPYELPNLLAYTESCAAIAQYFWNWRMLAATGDARFTDTMERALYNGINSGMSLDGTLYCYRNPLELAGNPDDKIRNPWYSTTCCPPNLERVLASLPGYFYSTSPEGIYVHFYDNNELKWKLEDGTGLRVRQKTQYPWKGGVEIAVDPASAKEFTVFVRIPAWSPSATVRVNGQKVAGAPKGGQYFPVRRQWKGGDIIALSFDITPQLMASNPRLRDNAGRVAVQRGPLIYAMEAIDQKDIGEAFFDAALTPARGSSAFREEFRPDLLGGVLLLTHPGRVPETPMSGQPLYNRFPGGSAVKYRTIDLTLIPYYAFSNRAPTAMQVWIPFAQ